MSNKDNYDKPYKRKLRNMIAIFLPTVNPYVVEPSEAMENFGSRQSSIILYIFM